MEITETVTAAGRTLLNYVSRNLTAKSGVTMRASETCESHGPGQKACYPMMFSIPGTFW